jgi:hypothetical protein
LVAHGAESLPAICWTKLPALCQGIRGIFEDISNFVIISYTISLRVRKDVLRKRDWGTLYKTEELFMTCTGKLCDLTVTCTVDMYWQKVAS